MHYNVTGSPCAQWAAQQIVNAFPYDTAPSFMIRESDGIYGSEFVGRVDAIGIEQVCTAPRSPWQNPYCERVIGSIRRECLNHVIILGAQHLVRILGEYVGNYHTARTHLSWAKDAPVPRPVIANDSGEVDWPMLCPVQCLAAEEGPDGHRGQAPYARELEPHRAAASSCNAGNRPANCAKPFRTAFRHLGPLAQRFSCARATSPGRSSISACTPPPLE